MIRGIYRYLGVLGSEAPDSSLPSISTDPKPHAPAPYTIWREEKLDTPPVRQYFESVGLDVRDAQTVQNL